MSFHRPKFRRVLRFGLVALIGGLGIAGCSGGGSGNASGGGGGTTTPQVTTNPAVTAARVYATNISSGTIDIYTANQNGSVTPVSTLAISTGFTVTAVTGDALGNLYVGGVTATGGAVQVFAAGATTPARTITLPNPGSPNSNQVTTLTTDAAGNLYVGTGQPAIYVFGAGATGPATPSRSILGAATLLLGGIQGVSELAVDSVGNLYVAEGDGYPGTSQVVIFGPKDTGNVAPTILTSSAYGPSGVALDSADNIYISQGSIGSSFAGATVHYASAIYVFAKGATAGATPIRTITGAATQLFPIVHNILVDSGGNIFVKQAAGLAGFQFLVFGASANGNVAPSSILTFQRGTTTDANFYLK